MGGELVEPAAAATRLEQCWNVERMHRAGARWCAAPTQASDRDKPHDVLPHGAVLFGRLGFSNTEALAAVTRTAAEACGLGARKGRLAPGYDADLLAVTGDPTADLRALLQVRAVIRAGRRVR